MSSIAPSKPKSCTNCKAPLNLKCVCEDCSLNFEPAARNYCHCCLEMSRTIHRSEYLSRIQSDWISDQNNKRGRMGL